MSYTSLVVSLQLFGFVAVKQNGGKQCSCCGLLVTVSYAIITLRFSPHEKNDAPKSTCSCAKKSNTSTYLPSKLAAASQVYFAHLNYVISILCYSHLQDFLF